MKRELETKFYEFNQNNSGGYFDVDKNVCNRVIIEAFDEVHAKSIFEPMIECQSGSCDCCGDRWSPEYSKEIMLSKFSENGYPCSVYLSDGEEKWFKLYGEFRRKEEPTWKIVSSIRKFVGIVYPDTIEEYCQLMANMYGWTSPDIRIHYLDGTKKEIFKKEINE